MHHGRRFVFMSLIIITLFSSTTIHAQSDPYSQFLKEGEAALQVILKDFRLVKRPETFPERFNATIAVPIETEPGGAIAALHDPVTGAPLEACRTPCTLNVDNVSEYGMAIYKFGYRPQVFPLSYEDANQKRPPYWLGINYDEVLFKHDACLTELKSSSMEDQDAKVCERVPPIMPLEAERSGHCKLTFDLSSEGVPMNIRAEFCSEPIFTDEAITAVSWWRYYPKIDRGQMVERTGIATKIAFRLSDEEGNIIPE